MLKLSEQPYVSLQGEGIQAGMPMTFLRLAGCNLRCTWCDTKYAWEGGFEMTEEEIYNHIAELSNYPWVCITGGEPFLQDLDRLIDVIIERSHYRRAIAVETNGTIIPKGDWLNFIDFLSVSPKMSNSGMRDRWKTNDLASLLWKYRRASVQLKFVCESTADILEAISLIVTLEDIMPASHFFWRTTPIIIQPQGLGKVTEMPTSVYLQNYKTLWEFVSHSNFRYDVRVLPQLHRLIYQSKRGV